MGPGAPAGVRYHHYVFDFFAVNSKIDLPATGVRPEMIEAMKGKVVGKASYVGRFKGEAGAGGPPRGPGVLARVAHRRRSASGPLLPSKSIRRANNARRSHHG